MMRQTSGLIAALGALCASCAVPVTEIPTGPGTQTYSMLCSGGFRSRADCMTRAAELCPAGWRVVDDNSRVIGSGGVVVTREELTIACQ